MIDIKYSVAKETLINDYNNPIPYQQLPVYKPSEIKQYQLEYFDYVIPDGAIVSIIGDTDLRSNTAVKIVGQNVTVIDDTTISFSLTSGTEYLNWVSAQTNQSGIIMLYIQIKIVTAEDIILHKFQLRGGCHCWWRYFAADLQLD